MPLQTEVDGRTVSQNDLAVQLLMSDTVMVQDLTDHLALVAAHPEAYSDSTSAAAQGALNLISVLAEQSGMAGSLPELGINTLAPEQIR